MKARVKVMVKKKYDLRATFTLRTVLELAYPLTAVALDNRESLRIGRPAPTGRISAPKARGGLSLPLQLFTVVLVLTGEY